MVGSRLYDISVNPLLDIETYNSLKSDMAKLINTIWTATKESSTRPPIPPYHIERWKVKDYSTLMELTGGRPIPISVELKYDGTHLQISPYGIFSHSGNPAADWQINGLIKACKREEVASAVRMMLHPAKRFIYSVELFGSKYTPMGFHKSHPYEWDIRVFQIGTPECGWLFYHPESIALDDKVEVFMWSECVRDLYPTGTIDPLYVEGSITNSNLLEDEEGLNTIIRGQPYEGIVIKMPLSMIASYLGASTWTLEDALSGNYEWVKFARRYFRHGIGIAKWKVDVKPQTKQKPKAFSDEFIAELENEVKKYIAEYGKPNEDEIFKAAHHILNSVLKAHPDFESELPSKSKRKKILKRIRKMLRER